MSSLKCNDSASVGSSMMSTDFGGSEFKNANVPFLIYDWDDTILPTSWLRTSGYLSNNISDMIDQPPIPLPPSVQAAMSEIENLTIEILKSSRTMGRTILVTNSSCLWIPFTCKRFFPALAEMLELDYEVYSARPIQAEQAGPTYVYLPSMAVTWKTDRFRELCVGGNFRTVVSIGDGFAERCAVLALYSPETSVKAIRLALQPSAAVLIEQLRVMLEHMPAIVDHADSGDVYLHPNGFRLLPMHGGSASLSGVVSLPPAAPIAAANPRPMRVEVSASRTHQTGQGGNGGPGHHGGIISALATGLAYCGRTLHRISGGGSNQQGGSDEGGENASVVNGNIESDEKRHKSSRMSPTLSASPLSQ